MKKQIIIANQNESTVIGEFIPKNNASDKYQSEADLEKEFIEKLVSQGYEYASHIKNDKELLKNLRIQIEKLNDYKFSDNEWDTLCKNYLIKPNDSIENRSEKIQKDNIFTLLCDNGTNKNIKILDINNINKNYLQVINQYSAINEEKGRHNIYDVTILVNGLPLAHIELKKRGVILKEAFNQINRYQRDTFLNTLFEYVQIFVISSGTETKYYSNTTRIRSIKEKDNSNKKTKTSNSFEFTSFWADAKNNTIHGLIDFTETFFSRYTLLNIICKYCVFTSEKMLMVLRPYQIVAAERVLNKISYSLRKPEILGTPKAGGFIWHTTGSGKTLTSFKIATLASSLPQIDKVIFIVDRKDLDYQTMTEYNKFQKGAADSVSRSKQLENKLNINSDVNIVITTIQKMAIFVKKHKGNNPIFNRNVVLIFDECHRSQFGSLNKTILNAFKNHIAFGFTGTPIMQINSNIKDNFRRKITTEDVFGDLLHSYTITKAIHDGNVLPFKIDYVGKARIKENEDINEKVSSINEDEVYLSDKRISGIVKYVLDKYDAKTRRNENVSIRIDENTKKIVKGFNSIFACDSISAAKKYYLEFKNQQSNLSDDKKLKVALIYSYIQNESEEDAEAGLLDENNDNLEGLDKSSRDFLDNAISDYNKMFDTSFSTSQKDGFNDYYKDLSRRLKNRDVDIVIVVNMFLTGFDAPTLNTLWVDKKLKYHGLIQAFSRTNRILNAVKKWGNIITFRNTEKDFDIAILIFSDGISKDEKIYKIYDFEYYYKGKSKKGEINNQENYLSIIQKIKDYYQKIMFDNKEEILELATEEDKKNFVNTYSAYLRMKNLLKGFDEFLEVEQISERQEQQYQSKYADLRDEFYQLRKAEQVSILEDVEFEYELIKSTEVNVNYIISVISKKLINESKNKEEVIDIINYDIVSSFGMRKKKDLIEEFIRTLVIDKNTDIYEQWGLFNQNKQNEELEIIIKKYSLLENETKLFMGNAFKYNEINKIGEKYNNIFDKKEYPIFSEETHSKKEKVFDILKEHFDKFNPTFN